jgi:hypothetical protein
VLVLAVLVLAVLVLAVSALTGLSSQPPPTKTGVTQTVRPRRPLQKSNG